MYILSFTFSCFAQYKHLSVMSHTQSSVLERKTVVAQGVVPDRLFVDCREGSSEGLAVAYIYLFLGWGNGRLARLTFNPMLLFTDVEKYFLLISVQKTASSFPFFFLR